jgi:hypothetical protein
MHNRLVQIADAKSLARVLRVVVDEDYGGNMSEAARAVGMQQSQLHRLANRKLGAVRWQTLLLLRKLLGRKRLPELDKAVVSPDVQNTLDCYRRWLARQQLNLRHRSRERNLWAQELGLLQWGGREVRRWLRRRVPELVKQFDGFLMRRGHLHERADLAYQRLLAPLWHSAATCGIERDLSDLPPKQLTAFVKAGIVRERILLERSPDLQRSQELEHV